MAYNEFLADRISQALTEKSVPFDEKRMMGGLTFMVDSKMCVGIIKESLMVRIDLALEYNPKAKSSKKRKKPEL